MIVPQSFEDGLLRTDEIEDIAAHVNGLPYTADGSLAVSLEGTVNHVSGGVPFDVNGRVCVGEGDPAWYLRGLAVTSAGRLCVAFSGDAVLHIGGLPATAAGAILANLNAAATFALDFEQDDYFGFSAAFAHTRATASSLVQQFDGSFVQMLANEWGREGGRRLRNLLNNTDALATQGVTVEAADYWLSFTGTGSVAVSGVATDSLAGTGASDRVAKKVTMGSAGTATFTVTGSVTNAYLYKSRAGQTVADPEYVSRGVLSAPYHGWGVDGVAWFKTDEEGADLTSASSGYPVRAAGIVRRPAVTNLVRNSGDWDGTGWSVNGSGAISVGGAGPFGPAEQMTTSGSTHGRYQILGTSASAAGEVYCASAYLRRVSGATSVYFSLGGTAFSGITAVFVANLETGTVTSPGTNGSVGRIDAVPGWSGWYRVSLAHTSNQAGTIVPAIYTYAMAGVFDCDELNVTQSSTPLPPVPTTTTAVTVDADVITLDKDEIGYSAAGGVWVIEHTPDFATNVSSNDQVLLDLYTSGTERALVYNQSSNLGVLVLDDGVSQWSANNAAANWVAGTQQRVAVRFVADDGSLVTDGVERFTDTSMTVPTVTSINIGGLAASKYSGTIERIAYYAEPV